MPGKIFFRFFFFLFSTVLLVDCSPVPSSYTHQSSSLSWADTLPHRSISAQCVWVGDGDTLKTADGDNVRLLGINAPEMAHPSVGKPVDEPFGKAARDYLKKMVLGESITLVIPLGRERDAYGRLLALVYAGENPDQNSKSINEALVEAGLAHVFIMENRGFLNTSAWVSTQRSAQDQRLGIWTLENSQLPQLATDTRNEAIDSIEEWRQSR